MNWRNKLKKLEGESDLPKTVDFLIAAVCDHPSEMDSYLYLAYFVMSLLLEEDCSPHEQDYYQTLLKKYFDESYEKFSDNPEYLYYMGMIAVMSEWLLDLDSEDYKRMLMKAIELDPENQLYQSNYYLRLDRAIPEQREAVEKYARFVLQENSPIKKQLSKKGALGEYIWGMVSHWSERVLGLLSYDW